MCSVFQPLRTFDLGVISGISPLSIDSNKNVVHPHLSSKQLCTRKNYYLLCMAWHAGTKNVIVIHMYVCVATFSFWWWQLTVILCLIISSYDLAGGCRMSWWGVMTRLLMLSQKSLGGHLNLFSPLGEDPLKDRADLICQREAEFFRQYPDFGLVFHSVIDGDCALFRYGLFSDWN